MSKTFISLDQTYFFNKTDMPKISVDYEVFLINCVSNYARRDSNLAIKNTGLNDFPFYPDSLYRYNELTIKIY
jgi:hypothetical protein